MIRKNKITTLAISLSLATTLFLAGCQTEPARIPETIPEVHGYLTNIKRTAVSDEESVATVLVAPLDGIKTKYPNASIKIGHHTLIKTKDGKTMKIEQLREGHEIEAWLEGDIKESMPVQAQAKAVRVIE